VILVATPFSPSIALANCSLLSLASAALLATSANGPSIVVLPSSSVPMVSPVIAFLASCDYSTIEYKLLRIFFVSVPKDTLTSETVFSQPKIASPAVVV
jgi:hypothetical protein